MDQASYSKATSPNYVGVGANGSGVGNEQDTKTSNQPGEVRRPVDRARARRIAAALNRDGVECSVGLVADLMRELGLRAVQPRAYKRTTIPGEAPASGRFANDARFAPAERLAVQGDCSSGFQANV